MASLETNDWAMIKIFDSLAYKQYREKNWGAMLNLKLRIRVGTQSELSSQVSALFDQDFSLGKKIFKSDRERILMKMCEYGFYYPLSLDNIVYFINLIDKTPDERLSAITPELMKEEMKACIRT